MKGIVLAGGSGTRLFPVTLPVCKQLLPIYDKPMIYYPLSTLMLAGIREIFILSTPLDTPRFEDLLGYGSHIGLRIEYCVQESPRGLADAFIVGKNFIVSDSIALVLGDNIFFGHNLVKLISDASMQKIGATVFGYYVTDPERYGVVEFDNSGRVISIEEKPDKPKSHYAVVGLYFYDNRVVEIAENLAPSARGEIEITDVNRKYLELGELSVQLMGRGYAWLDTGTHHDLHEAGSFVRSIQERQGLQIACPEEIAFEAGWIDQKLLLKQAKLFQGNRYGEYLYGLVGQ